MAPSKSISDIDFEGALINTEKGRKNNSKNRSKKGHNQYQKINPMINFPNTF